MRRKGISPLIAAVLLIAFTMAVATIFAQWAPDIIQGVTQDTDQQQQDLIDSTNAQLDIERVQFDGAKYTLTVRNSGEGNLTNFTVTTYQDNPVQKSWDTYLEKGQVKTVTINGDKDADRIEVEAESISTKAETDLDEVETTAHGIDYFEDGDMDEYNKSAFNDETSDYSHSFISSPVSEADQALNFSHGSGGSYAAVYSSSQFWEGDLHNRPSSGDTIRMDIYLAGDGSGLKGFAYANNGTEANSDFSNREGFTAYFDNSQLVMYELDSGGSSTDDATDSSFSIPSGKWYTLEAVWDSEDTAQNEIVTNLYYENNMSKIGSTSFTSDKYDDHRAVSLVVYDADTYAYFDNFRIVN